MEGVTRSDDFRCGTVVLFGRPNAGKSTLINALVGERLAIVTHKPQTTRHQVVGIVNRPGGQIVLVDTPGLHKRRDHALNRHLNRVAAESLAGVDLVALIIDASAPREEDRLAARAVAQSGQPAVLVFNKIDRLAEREVLLERTQEWSSTINARAVFYVSARKQDGVEVLSDGLLGHLPSQPALFEPDQFTTASARFLAAELIREQVLENLHQEVPYGATVVVERFDQGAGKISIDARILVSEARHKGMVIGKQAQTVKRIGTRARQRMRELFGEPVHLSLDVGVEPGWIDRDAAIEKLGYTR